MPPLNISGGKAAEVAVRVGVEDFQWIWAVLSGFRKTVMLGEVLEYELPGADGYDGFWKNPVSIQHPLAELELVAWDGSCTLLISRDETVAKHFMNAFPKSRDLAAYNENHGLFDETGEYEQWLRENRVTFHRQYPARHFL